MEVYETEREQIEAIKKWWKENGKAIVTGLVLGLASLLGWQQWHAYSTQKSAAASAEYEGLLSELEQQKFDSAKEYGNRILSQFPGTPYADLSALALAKIHVEQGDLALARNYLQMVIDGADQVQLRQVARIRMARLQLAEGQAQEALRTLGGIGSDGFDVVYYELKGDAHLALGDRAAAREAYSKALASMEPGLDSSILTMKLDEVGGPEETP